MADPKAGAHGGPTPLRQPRANGATAADGLTRVALYARVSTRDKDQDPELQLEAMRDYLRTRGWEASEYVDTAAAGDLAHRTAWARLLADVARRRVDLVMVWKLDRAFRSTLHALATLRDFEHAGVGFASQTQPELDTTSPTGRLVFTILAAVAEMERELIRDRVKEGMRHAARQGIRIGRPPVTARPGFAGRWDRVQADLTSGTVSRRGAARRLGIGTATLGRLLAAADPQEVAAGAQHGPTPQPLVSALRRVSRKVPTAAERVVGTPGARSRAADATKQRGSRHG